MLIALVIITALWVGFSGFSLLRKAEFVVKPLVDCGVPRSWWPWLGAAKTAGAIGLPAGLAGHVRSHAVRWATYA